MLLSNKHACDKVICVINIDLAPLNESLSLPFSPLLLLVSRSSQCLLRKAWWYTPMKRLHETYRLFVQAKQSLAIETRGWQSNSKLLTVTLPLSSPFSSPVSLLFCPLFFRSYPVVCIFLVLKVLGCYTLFPITCKIFNPLRTQPVWVVLTWENSSRLVLPTPQIFPFARDLPFFK